MNLTFFPEIRLCYAGKLKNKIDYNEQKRKPSIR